MITSVTGAVVAMTLLSLSSSSAIAEVQSAALNASFEICSELPLSSDLVAKRLSEKGWASDEQAVGTAFFSSSFAFNLNPDDISYSLDNGAFMAASILGNSAMPRSQPGFSVGDVKLAVLMGDTKKGYCVLSGGSVLLEELKTKVTLNETLSSPVHRKLTGNLSKHPIIVVVLDRAKLEPIIATAKPQYVKPADFFFDEVNVFFAPVKQEE